MIITNKIKLKNLIWSAQKKGRKVLIKRGVFDIIHSGHINAISDFKKRADVVVILVMSDELVRLRKGKERPINNQKQRMYVVNRLMGVDYVYSDKANTLEEYEQLIDFLNPDILALTKLNKHKLAEKITSSIKIKVFPERYQESSTTRIIKKILLRYRRK